MKHLFCLFFFLSLLTSCTQQSEEEKAFTSSFIRIEGENLIQPNGDTLHIKGTNLGNWLNPEGYMFGFTKVRIKSDKQKNVAKLLADRRFRKMA